MLSTNSLILERNGLKYTMAQYCLYCDLETLKFVYSDVRHCIEYRDIEEPHITELCFDENSYVNAARCGNMEILNWLREKNVKWDSWTFVSGVINGNLSNLDWMRRNGCPWNTWCCAYAAMSGNLEVLQWLRRNGCLWDKWTTNWAAGGLNSIVFIWAINNKCPLEPLEAIKHARDNIVKLKEAVNHMCEYDIGQIKAKYETILNTCVTIGNLKNI